MITDYQTDIRQMNDKELRGHVEAMIVDLRQKVEQEVPDEGDFPMVYSLFKVTDDKLCLTNIMLSLIPKPKNLPDHETERWLELSGYRLPIPYKISTMVSCGTKKEVLTFLDLPETIDKILQAIPRLDYNMRDL